MKDPIQEIKNLLLAKKEEYKQAVERHEFLELHEIKEDIKALQIQWQELATEKVQEKRVVGD
ncbi:hypothetical protein [Marininema halotolerans]|uniref:Uncharacterized protein n=1 Tax=Marininema halotolerans TaxID=1155944 RepID=A0A1I6RQB9_9BACL|nr:hypothetical protein [Marininema halotolerans]SFS66884.1 hypothetical protein SAMN05444972_105287 [Marininema halotolerans]